MGLRKLTLLKESLLCITQDKRSAVIAGFTQAGPNCTQDCDYLTVDYTNCEPGCPNTPQVTTTNQKITCPKCKPDSYLG